MKIIPPSKAILDLLANSEIARNDYRKWYIEFLQKNYCVNEAEKAIIERILTKAMSQSTFQRECAYVQNTMWLYQANDDVKQKRLKHCKKIGNEISQAKAKMFSFKNLFRLKT
jgi:hypothetical protein